MFVKKCKAGNMTNRIKTKEVYNLPKKEIIINAKRTYLHRYNWNEDVYLFYVYCHIANRCEFFEYEYNSEFCVKTAKLVKDLMLEEDTVVSAINELISKGLLEAYENSEDCDSYYFSLTD